MYKKFLVIFLIALLTSTLLGNNQVAISQEPSIEVLRAESRRLLEQGNQFLQAGSPDEALPLLEEALEVAQNTRDRRQEADTRVALCAAYRVGAARFNEAVDQCEQAISIYQSLDDIPAVAETFERLGRYFYIFDPGESEECVEYIDQAILLYRELGDIDQEVEAIVAVTTCLDRIREVRATDLPRLQEIYTQVHDFDLRVSVMERMAFMAEKAGRRDEAEVLLQEISILHREREDWEGESNFYVRLSDWYRTFFSDHDLFIYYRSQAAEVYRQLGDFEAEVDSILGTMSILNGWYYGGLDIKLSFYQRAAEIKESLGDYDSLASIYCSMGSLYLEALQYEEAILNYEQSLRFSQLASISSNEACAIQPLAEAYHAVGQNEEALARYQQIRYVNGLADADLTRGMARVYQETEDYEGVVSLYLEAIEESLASSNFAQASDMHQELVDFYIEREQYESAIVGYQKIIEIWQSVGNMSYEIAATAKLARLYRELNRNDEAAFQYEHIISLNQELAELGRRSEIPDELESFYLGQVGIDEAIIQHWRLVDIAHELNDLSGEAKALANLVYFYDKKQDHVSTDHTLTRLEQLVSAAQAENSSSLSMLSYHLGRAYLDLRQYSEANAVFQISINTCLNNLGSYASTLLCLQEPYTGLSISLLSTPNDEGSQSTLYQVIDNIERLDAGDFYFPEYVAFGDRQFGDSLRYGNFQSYFPYLALQEKLVSSGAVEDALIVSERSRSTGLVIELEEQVLQQEFSEELNSQYWYDLVWSWQEDGGDELNYLLTGKTIDLAAVRQVAQTENTVIVHYSINDIDEYNSTLYIWITKPSGEIYFHEVNLEDHENSLFNLINVSREAIETRDIAHIAVISSSESSESAQRERQNLRALYNLLIKPIEEYLPEDAETKILFIPQSELFLVPFSALVDERGQYFVERHPVYTAHSIQALALFDQLYDSQEFNLAETLPSEVLVVGNPSPMPSLSVSENQLPQQLSSLPGAEAEALSVANLFRTSPLIGEEAKEHKVVEQMQTASIIHLATHGLMHTGDSLYQESGAIALAPDPNAPMTYQWHPEEGRLDDGFLAAEEINDMDLRAQLVVLSACDTGRGDVNRDGVMALSRAFMQAGVPTVLASLWKVPDDSTAFLMTQFYTHWKEGASKAQALRLAMLDTMQIYPEPVNWAAFTIAGEAQ
ncbi:CHAT domain-containing protein [Leptolyngbya sp. CCY15150]|uniref:CHAT domain-containing tetratricopeptide repeat protein n=1 Tax=Leptolyngbya sp. CCY15150 TaxID=2767772 RepID=UPI0019519217|nr:CHAT domain-containing protein [Leptolyngbya sp. CCY15150]